MSFVPNTSLQDGSIRLVEQVVSLLTPAGSTGTATNFILKTGALNVGVRKVKSEDQNGVFRGKGLALDEEEGSMTLQFVNSGDLKPAPLQYFEAMDSSGATRKLILESVGDKFGAFEEAMIDCKISACINPTAVTATLPSLTPS